MEILLTGGSGFIGARLVPVLIAQGHRVVAAGRTPAPPAGHVDADLASPGFSTGWPARIDAVVCLAQSRRFRDLPAGQSDLETVNRTAVAECLAYALRAGASRFLLASTGGVYAPSATLLREGDTLAPVGPYQRIKLEAETLAQGCADRLAVAILRPFFVYGPGQRGMMIANLAGRVLAGEEVTIEGDPGMRVTPTHVEDAVAAIAGAVSGSLRGAFNLAGPEAVHISTLVRLIGEAAGCEVRLRHIPGDSERGYAGDGSKLRAELRLGPCLPLREGLAAVVRAMR